MRDTRDEGRRSTSALCYRSPEKRGVSWCCGNYCLLAFVLWCGYCSVSFQSFVLRHWCPQHQETTEKREKIVPILQAVRGNYKIPLVFCRAIEEYVSKVTSRLVGWLKSAGTSSITAATMKTAKETLYKTRSNSRHWLNRFPPKPGYDEATVHSNNWVCG